MLHSCEDQMTEDPTFPYHCRKTDGLLSFGSTLDSVGKTYQVDGILLDILRNRSWVVTIDRHVVPRLWRTKWLLPQVDPSSS